MMHLNFLLAALFVASAVSAPVHTNVVSTTPPHVTTAVPTTVTLPIARSVLTSVWQHDRRVLDHDVVRPPPTPASALPLPPSPIMGDKTLNVRAVTNSFGAVTTVTLPLPTATAPHAHVHRADVGASACDDAELDANEDAKRDLHARMLALPIKGLQLRPHATTTLNTIKARQLFLPTALVNGAAVAKVSVA